MCLCDSVVCDPRPNGDGGQTVVDHIRLFPVRMKVRSATSCKMTVGIIWGLSAVLSRE
jgi:hypothetical protein